MARPAAREGGAGRLLRTAGVGVVAATALYLAVQTFALLGQDETGSLVRRYAVAASFALAAVSTGAMAVDLADRWLLGGRITDFSRKMTRSLVFVSLLVAFALTLVVRGPSFFLVMTPALVIYLVGTWQRPGERAAPARRPSSAGAGRGRQRRGGRRRR